MLSEDQYLERTPDLVTKVRKLREAAEKEMNRFTRVADYDVRHVVGHGPTATPVPGKTVDPTPAGEYPDESTAQPVTDQSSMEFLSASAKQGDAGEPS